MSSNVSRIGSNLEMASRNQKLYNFLKTTCPESSDCVILGKYMDLLINYFDNFNIEGLKSIKLIGTPSANGFVNEFVYSKHNYDAYCALKSSQSTDSDNLFAEWYIGHTFINKMVPKFPCFMETYRLGFYTKINGICAYNLFINAKRPVNNPMESVRLRKIVSSFEFVDSNKIIKELTNTTTDNRYHILPHMSCTQPINFCLLMQHMKNPISFGDFIDQNMSTEYGFNIDIFQLFLQIFIPLGKLEHNFTHNDLHTNNVLLYTIPNNNYIILKYIFQEKPTIEIKSRYIAKIIDYGRAYFKLDEDNTSGTLFKWLSEQNEICATDKDENGYAFFEPPNIDNYYISQTQGNVSKDLWLPGIYLKSLICSKNKYEGRDKLSYNIWSLLDRIVGGDVTDYKNIKPRQRWKSDTINTVSMFMTELCNVYIDNYTYINQKYNETLTGNCIGQLEIFVDDLTKDSQFTAITSAVPDLPSDVSDLTSALSGGINKHKRKTTNRRKHTNKRKTTNKRRKIKKNKIIHNYK